MTVPAARSIVAQILSMEFGGELTRAPAVDPVLAREIIGIAQRNKVLKAVLKGLEYLGVPLPEDMQDEVALYLRKTMKNNAGAIATVREVSKKLSDGGVVHVAYKGPVRQIALAQDVFERPVADVDILVRQSDFGRATALLNEIGYAVPPICDSPWWRHFLGEQHFFDNGRRRSVVDLHHRTQQPSCPRPRDQEALLDDRRWIDVGGQPIATLGTNSNFLNTVMSVVKGVVNREPTGAHVIDLARQLHSADSALRMQFEQAARDQGLVKSYAVARRAVMVMTGVEVGATPRWFVSDERLLAMLLTPLDPGFQWEHRRNMLWHLVDDETPVARVVNFAREFAWMTAAEFTRRTHDVSGQ